MISVAGHSLASVAFGSAATILRLVRPQSLERSIRPIHEIGPWDLDQIPIEPTFILLRKFPEVMSVPEMGPTASRYL